MGKRSVLRAEETAGAGDEGDGDVLHVGDGEEEFRDVVVVILGEGIELLGEVERDDGDVVTLCEGDVFGGIDL